MHFKVKKKVTALKTFQIAVLDFFSWFEIGKAKKN